MNAANLTKSERLQRVFKLLSGGGEYTTLEIIQKAGVCAVNSIISELRQNGYQIDCQRRHDKWFYRMTI
jgi:predicted transcriptional regulator